MRSSTAKKMKRTTIVGKKTSRDPMKTRTYQQMTHRRPEIDMDRNQAAGDQLSTKTAGMNFGLQATVAEAEIATKV